MKLKYIKIEFEYEEKDNAPPNSGTVMEFLNGQWSVNGPMYSRYYNMAHAIWRLVKNTIQGTL